MSKRYLYQLPSLTNVTRHIFARGYRPPVKHAPGVIDYPPIPRKRRKLFGGK